MANIYYLNDHQLFALKLQVVIKLTASAFFNSNIITSTISVQVKNCNVDCHRVII